MTSEGLLFTALRGTLATHRLRAVFANALQIRRVIVVGYGNKQTGTAQYTGVGSFFFGLGADEKVDLFDIKLEADGYMDPDFEYIRELNPASAGNLNCYAYVNEAFLHDAIGPTLTPAQLAMVGWWKCPTNGDSIWDLVYDGDDSLKLQKGEKMIDPRVAFLGQFSGSVNLKFVCSGQVICATTQVESKNVQYLFIHNYTPTNVKLTDLEVETDDGGYMDPDFEYFRELNPASAGNLNCYVYVNEAFLHDAIGPTLTPAQLAMVGWWKCPTNGDSIWDLVYDGDTENMITEDTDITLTPGFALLGQFSGSYNSKIKFPDPTKPVVK